MDPSYYLRIVIGNLALRLPNSLNIPSSFCKLKFLNLPLQTSSIPILNSDSTHPLDPTHFGSVSACFTLTRADIDRVVEKKQKPVLKIDVYSGCSDGCCGFGSGFGKFLGRVVVPVEVGGFGEGKMSRVMQNGWVLVGQKKKKKGLELGLDLNPELYLSVKAHPDPRFVFEFDGEPECSPQVFQVQGQGSIKQPVFSCKFSFRHSGDPNLRSSSTMSDPTNSRSWLPSLKSDKDNHHHHHHPKHQPKERKGWSITIHDLSGSPVAAASMVTPFVPSPGSNRVCRSNPGAWLILRPADSTWKPWARLEAWRDRNGLGHRFEVLPDASPATMGPTGITLAQSAIPARRGGTFTIDVTNGGSPAGSPNGSFDFASWTGSGSSSGSDMGSGSGWWPGFMYKGFVMSSTVGGEGKRSRPVVEVGAQHVTCTEDAAVFVALAAAVDLSMDACMPFSHKLRKELSGDVVV